MKKKFFPYSGFLSGIFAPEAREKHIQDHLNGQLEYAVLTGNYRQTDRLMKAGAEPNEELLMHAVTQKWTRFSELFLSFGVEPAETMSAIAVKQADKDTLRLLLEHRCPVSDESRVWASVYGSREIKETLGGLAGKGGPFHGGKTPGKKDVLTPS